MFYQIFKFLQYLNQFIMKVAISLSIRKFQQSCDPYVMENVYYTLQICKNANYTLSLFYILKSLN
jgi:hypothetical protein